MLNFRLGSDGIGIRRNKIEIAYKIRKIQKITLRNFADECQRILNLRADTVKIKKRDISHSHAVRNKPKSKEKKKPLLKLIPALVVAIYIYIKIVL